MKAERVGQRRRDDRKRSPQFVVRGPPESHRREGATDLASDVLVDHFCRLALAEPVAHKDSSRRWITF